MRAQGVAKFGDRFSAERRVLAHREEFIRGRVSTENCLNCGEVLTGQHCSHCGQRARVRVLSLWSMLSDVIGDALNWDSRLWRTLRPLAFSPGVLTQEFLRGRRAHYTPPFRMYLMLSVAFFLSTTLGADPGADLHFDVGNDGANLQLREGNHAPAPDGSKTPATSATPATPKTPPPKLDPARQQIVDAIVGKLPKNDQAQARDELQRKLATLKPEEVATVNRVVANPCTADNLKIDIGPLGEKYAPRLREACNKIVTDSQGFGRALYDNIPKMMFIFLPVIACVMYVLYLGSGRYYVEHLLFFVHFHAFFFLGGIAIVLLDRGGTLFKGTQAGSLMTSLGNLLTGLFMLYAPIYLYRAMRRVYGQGRIVTLLKYATLGVGYLFLLTVTAVGLLFYTALTL
jgi:hypothetical protein